METFRVALVSLALAMASSAVLAAGAKNPYTNVHTIGVIAVLESAGIQIDGCEDYRGIRGGRIVQLNWGLDAVIADKVTATLSGNYSARTIEVDPATFADATAPVGGIRGISFQDRVLALPSSQDVDAYVIVHPVRLETSMFAYCVLKGLSLFKGGFDRTGLFAVYQVTVVDAKTGKSLDYGSAKVRGGGLFGDMGALRACDVPWTDPDQLSDDQKAVLRSEAVKLLGASLPLALEGANLIDHKTSLAQEAALAEPSTLCHRPP